MAKDTQLSVLKKVLDTAPHAFLIFDESGCCLHGNSASRDLLGYTHQEMQGISAETLFPALFSLGNSEWGEGVWLATLDNESLAMTKQGGLIPIRVSASKLKQNSPQYFAFYVQDITQEKHNEEFMLQLQYLDTTTGLANRTLFVEKLVSLLEKAEEEETTCGLLQIGLDRFKYVNDSFGYRFGDNLLCAVGQRLYDTTRRGDTVAYLGGDEFALILPNASQEKTLQMAYNILEQMQSPFCIEGTEIYLTCSIGVVLYPDAGNSEDKLRKNLHSALHLAKQSGRNNVQIYSPLLALQAEKRIRMHADMHTALAQYQFSLYYQPLVNPQNGRIKGMEALIRWRHPEKGMIPPGEFIGFAEDNGLICEIGRWAMWTACEQTQKWHEMGFPLRVSVNVSLKQLLEPDFVEGVVQVLSETKLPPSSLDIEITESLAMEQFDTIVPKLAALREMDIRISLDDFGTGYSSLNYLTTLPITKVKLDRGLVQFTNTEQKEAIMVKSIIQMAHQLNLEVVAEGIETTEQLQCLKEYGCDTIQGYFYSRPLPTPSFEQLLWQQPWNPVAHAA